MTHQIKIASTEFNFPVKPKQSVLDAALEAGLLIPYSCKVGSCHSCKGRVREGSYETSSNIELEPFEKEAGFTLFCQCFPTSDVTIEVMDVRVAGAVQTKKMPVRVIEMNRLKPHIMQLKLQMPASESFNFYPGQYLEFILKSGKRRSYSMACIPNPDNIVELHIKQVEAGHFSDYVFGISQPSMRLREIMRIQGPMGGCTLSDHDKPIIMVCTGTGFAPIKSMVEHIIAHQIPRSVHLYWGGRNKDDLYLLAMAQQWAEDHANIRLTAALTRPRPEDNWEGPVGRLPALVAQDYPDMSAYEVYACGAPPVVESARDCFVGQCGLPESAFISDAFVAQP